MNNLSSFVANYNRSVVRKELLSVSRVSNFTLALSHLLFRQRYISAYFVKSGNLLLQVKYANGSPALRSLRCVSKPSKRVYVKNTNVCVRSSIISTSKGLIYATVNSRAKYGGELILELI